MVILLVVRLLQLDLDTFEGYIHGLAHIFFVGRGYNLGANNVHGDFAMTAIFNFVIKDDGGACDIRVEAS